ncbi:hypothetical protein, partial [uncultured Alcanivorax sp.]|uniref:hypothetical protein n=1 Tax=uncultured Alcanivorax sp. TaxID=191215 RepID=UPI0026324ED1
FTDTFSNSGLAPNCMVRLAVVSNVLIRLEKRKARLMRDISGESAREARALSHSDWHQDRAGNECRVHRA